MAIFLLCPNMAERAKELSGVSFIKGANLIHEDPTLMTYHILKAPSPNTIVLGIRFQYMSFGGTQSITLTNETSQRVYKLRLGERMFLGSCFAKWFAKVE